MLYQLDKNMLVKGECVNAIKLIEGLASYDFIYFDPPSYKSNKMSFMSETLGKAKWLQDMRGLIEKAHELINEDGAIGFHIDKENYTNVRLIMDEFFGSENYVNTFIINNQASNSLNDRNKTLEFLLVYQKSDQFYFKNPYKRACVGGVNRRHNMFYSIDDLVTQYDKGLWTKEKELYKSEATEKPADSVSFTSCWSAYKKQNETKSKNEMNYRGFFHKKHKVENKQNEWMDKKTESNGLKKLETIKNVLSIFTNKKSKFLDFFAGSGITAQAVMELNAVDGGHRQFTLMTNSKNSIDSTICKPRIDKVASLHNETYEYIVID